MELSQTARVGERGRAASEGVPLVGVGVLDRDAGPAVGLEAGGDGEVTGDDADLRRREARGRYTALAVDGDIREIKAAVDLMSWLDANEIDPAGHHPERPGQLAR
ncbi:hypothetical protein [Streptomyces sp. P9-2]|uniref:hypothetical protein n=1 Tax=Streptomyces sp. P9-2 TaxID=3423201 RepID=UPI003F74537B